MTEFFTEEEKEHILDIKRKLIDIFFRHPSENRLWSDPFSNADSFHDVKVPDLFLSGGAIASLLQGEMINDLDIYSRVPLTKFADKLITEYNSSIAEIYGEYRDIAPSFMGGKMITEKAITMKDGTSYILMHYGSPEYVKRTFDFVHCMPHFSFADRKLYISKEQYDACVNKILVPNNKGQLKSWRINKFKQRGYSDKLIEESVYK